MSWTPVVITHQGESVQNALRFATEQEAIDYLEDLSSRWTLVKDFQTIEGDDPVNYEWKEGRLYYIKDWQERWEREVYARNPELLD